MRVIFDTSPGPYTPGGTRTYIENLFQSLSDISNVDNVDIVGSRLPRWLLPERGKGLRHKLRVASWDTLYMHAILPYRVARHSADVLHTPAARLPLQVSVPTVTTIYDTIPFIFPSLFRRRDRMVLRAYMRLAAYRSAEIITISEQSRQDINRLLGVSKDRIKVTYPGISSQFHPAAEREILMVQTKYGITEPYILSVGTIEPRKNLVRVLQMFASLKQEKEIPHRLVLVGKSGWLDGPVYETIYNLGIERHIQFTGYVDENDLPSLYSAASVFVYPSLYEGFGLPPLEAMACGCPVVTSNTSALPEVVGGAGVLVDPTNVRALSEAVATVLNDQQCADTLRKSGVEQASKFSWINCAKQTVEAYMHALRKNG